MKRALVIVSAVIVLFGSGRVSEAQEPQSIVDRFYPERLTPARQEDRHSCHRVLRTTQIDEPDAVVAGYTDATTAVVRLLTRIAPDAYVVAYETPASMATVGLDCTMSGPDIDGNGQPDVWLALSGSQGSSHWVFRWTGFTLVDVTPTFTRDGREHTQLIDAAVFDLSHDGSLHLVSTGRSRDEASADVVQPSSQRVFRLGSTKYELDTRTIAVARFTAGPEPPATPTRFASVADSPGGFSVRVVNGDRAGRRRATSGVVSINGVALLADGQLNDRVEFLTRPLGNLLPANRLVATITGPSDAELLVAIEVGAPR